MSASLIRRGLELLSNDIKGDNKLKKKKQSTPSAATVRGLVSTKRQGVTRQVKRLQGRLCPAKSKATVKDKRIKCAVDEFRKKQQKSPISDNLKYLMRTSFKADRSDTSKIQSYNAGRQSRNRPDKPTQEPKEMSVFTEKEFQQFQKEYFGTTVAAKKKSSSKQ
ncbi:ribosomal protein S19 binding protein 1 [Dunckerocampus dactyliophorus]|uniref:ribosomal protein S19 binding protein 1 n=1 Tax=Dunckerocampus dactyliophorus TaxID=161453 RepID=UPI0024068753|nr:ribosomal protein S19 binding protein 1 [Dunckerocampus dactyliophorus]